LKSNQKTRTKYLTQYAEKEVLALASWPKNSDFSHVIVIPAYNEKNNFIERFVHSALASQHCLLIVVVNQPDNEQGRNCSHAQHALATHILSLGEMSWQRSNLSLVKLSASKQNTAINSSILLVDRFNTPIASEQGVGLARKVGADIASYLISQEQITSRWIHSTDADASLPDNYVSAHEQTHSNTDLKAAVSTCCNFYHHTDDEEINRANQQYELALRYYVAGLAYAKSPYAYFTIGSLLSFDVDAYCQARGFPKRSAGEDFYLLNKLAKLGNVVQLTDVTIKLDARPSDRVPFGTGPAVQNIMALTAQGQDYQYYHPEVFNHLKTLLAEFSKLWQYRDNIEAWLNNHPLPSQQALKDIGFFSFVDKQKSAAQPQFDKQLIVWFDAFKTLKYIHGLRDQGLNNIALTQAIASADFDVF
jgi:hypothetical protein